MRCFQSFNRVRYLNRHVFSPNIEFLTAYRLLKRCYSWPDYALCALLASPPTQLTRWKHGFNRPRPSIIGFIAVLVMFRIGAAKTGHDLLRAGRLLSTGELERMVDKFLVEEEQAIAKQKAKKRNQAQKSVSDRTPKPSQPTDYQI